MKIERIKNKLTIGSGRDKCICGKSIDAERALAAKLLACRELAATLLSARALASIALILRSQYPILRSQGG